MTDSRGSVNAVLAALARNERPSEIELAGVILMEEPARRGYAGILLLGTRENTAAASAVASAAVRLANSSGGGAIILGVEQGTASLLGTALAAAWLRNRIRLLIEIDTEVEERSADGARLLVIYVAHSRVRVVDVEDQALR